jgi:hypothetical protein
MIAHIGIETGRGFDAKVSLGLERGGTEHLGNATGVLLIGRILECGEQRLQFGGERRRQACIDEGRLEWRRRVDDGLAFREQGRVAAGTRRNIGLMPG